MILYFAYGSNMNKQRMILRDVSFRRRFSGVLYDWKLIFNAINEDEKAGSANIVFSKDSKVEGAVYETDEESLIKLDKFEIHYDRKKILIKDESGKEIECHVYITHPEQTKDGLKPTKKYLMHLLEGKDLISKEYFDFLSDISTLD